MSVRTRKRASRASLVFVVFCSVAAFSTHASADPMFFGSVHADAHGCPSGFTCPPDPTISDSQSFTQGPTLLPISINGSAGAPNASASDSVEVNSSGVHGGGSVATSNPGNVVGAPGVGSFIDLRGSIGSQFLLSSGSLPPGSLVSLMVSFGFSGNLFTQSEGGSGSVAGASVGPFIAYGSNPVTESSFFDVFAYEINNAGSPGITTPGTLALQINEVGGQPVATVTGSSDFMPAGFGGTLSLSPSQTFTVLLQATIGEPFRSGVRLHAFASAGSDIPCSDVFDLPPCDAQASVSLLDLSPASFQLPEGVLMTQVVPEPASLLLMGSGLAGLAAWRRRTRNMFKRGRSPINQ